MLLRAVLEALSVAHHALMEVYAEASPGDWNATAHRISVELRAMSLPVRTIALPVVYARMAAACARRA